MNALILFLLCVHMMKSSEHNPVASIPFLYQRCNVLTHFLLLCSQSIGPQDLDCKKEMEDVKTPLIEEREKRKRTVGRSFSCDQLEAEA